MNTINIVRIVEGTSVDGPGLRTSIYFAGCRHQCPGCHNQQTWDFAAGTPTTVEEVMKTVCYNDFNVTFSGGDPMYSAQAIVPLAKKIKEAGYSIWCYTGFTFEEIINIRDIHQRQVRAGKEMIVMIGPVSICGFKQRHFCTDLRFITPSNAMPFGKMN